MSGFLTTVVKSGVLVTEVTEAGNCILHIMTFPGAQNLFTVDHQVSAAVKDSQRLNRTSITAPLSQVPCAPFRHASESAGLRRRRAARKGGPGGGSGLRGMIPAPGSGRQRSGAGQLIVPSRQTSTCQQRPHVGQWFGAKFSSVFLRGYLLYNLQDWRFIIHHLYILHPTVPDASFGRNTTTAFALRFYMRWWKHH